MIEKNHYFEAKCRVDSVYTLVIFQAMLVNEILRNFSKDMAAYVKSWSKMVTVLWSLMTTAMRMMPPMI